MHLWTEQNESKKLQWLRTKEKEAHPILLFEQAISEYSMGPSDQDVAKKVAYLFKLAIFRCLQDASCFQVPSIQGSIHVFVQFYMDRIQEVKGYSKDTILANFNSEETNHNSIAKIKELIHNMTTNPHNFPSPYWIQASGLAMLNPERSTIIENWQQKRIQFAQSSIRELLHPTSLLDEFWRQQCLTAEIIEEAIGEEAHNGWSWSLNRSASDKQISKENMGKIIELYNSRNKSLLSNEQWLGQIEEAYQSEHVVELFTFLHNPPNPQILINWLEAKQEAMHPLLMMKLAVETAKFNPCDANFFWKNVAPQFCLAKLRLNMDKHCLKKPEDAEKFCSEMTRFFLYEIFLYGLGNNRSLYEDELGELNKLEKSDFVIQALKDMEKKLEELHIPQCIANQSCQWLENNTNDLLPSEQVLKQRRDYIQQHLE